MTPVPRELEVIEIDVDQIHVSDKRRPIDEAKLDELGKSIDTLGLLNPPTIAFIEGRAHLGAGHHRLELWKRRGYKRIRCTVLPPHPLRLELAEIDENLFRKDLSPAEHAELTALREEIMAKLEEQEQSSTAQDGLATTAKPDPTDQNRQSPNKPSLRKQAKKTGESKDKIHRSKTRAKKLGAKILGMIKGTSLDKGVEIDALADLPESERVELAMQAQKGEDVSARRIKRATSEAPHVQVTRQEEARVKFISWTRDYADVPILSRLTEPISLIETALSSEPITE